jgi:hypothetical protein
MFQHTRLNILKSHVTRVSLNLNSFFSFRVLTRVYWNMHYFSPVQLDFPYTSEKETKCTILYFCMFYFHLFNVLLKKVKNVNIFHEIDKLEAQVSLYRSPDINKSTCHRWSLGGQLPKLCSVIPISVQNCHRQQT